MAWLILFAASLLEIAGALALKHADGLTRPFPTFLSFAAMTASVGLLGLAVKTLPLGTAYAVWTAVGTLGTVLIGIAVGGEAASIVRVASILLIVAGVVGLKLAHAG